MGVLDCFLYLLNSAEGEIIGLALQGILKILDVGSAEKDDGGTTADDLVEILEARGGTQIIEGLQGHQNKEITSIVFDIVNKHLRARKASRA